MIQPSAREIAARIRQRSGVQFAPDFTTVDRFVAGNPDALVRGIAVTMMPSLEVLRDAARAGCNFVIAHEPAFYNHTDDSGQKSDLAREADAIWQIKRDFIEENGLILWRYHDTPHRQPTDAILSGMVETLGWRAFQNPRDQQLFEMPRLTLSALARQIRDTLGTKALRAVGDPDLSVTKVALAPGFVGFERQRHLLQNPAVEVLVLGECHEWETVSYAADAGAAGLAKALIVTGHIPSEEGGMKAIARWIGEVAPEVPIVFVPSAEPFWTPKTLA